MKRGKFESQPVAKKNNGKKIVSLLLVLVLLLGAVVGTTLAWLVDTPDPITNTFIVGNVDIDLTETQGTDVTGGKQFKMTPGAIVAKNPKVSVTATSESCYLFVKIVEANNSYTPEGGEATTIVNYSVTDAGWTELAVDGLNVGEAVYYRTWTNGSAETEFSVFNGDKVTISSALDKDYMDEVGSSITAPSLTITAYAIQSADLTDTAADVNTDVDPIDAWTLLTAQIG